MSDPYITLFPADWHNDQGLKRCSFAARGLWIELMMIMQQAEPYGKLVVAGVPYGVEDFKEIADELRIGAVSEVKMLLKQLEKRGVFSVDEAGTIYSRRMIRDREQRESSRENGKKGGNPALKTRPKTPENDPFEREVVNPPVKAADNSKLLHSTPYISPTPLSREREREESTEPEIAVAAVEPVDMSDLDDEPSPDQRRYLPPEDAPPSIAGVSFARWWTTTGAAEGAISGHHLLDASGGLEFARKRDGIQVANALIAAYGRPAVEAAALRMFAAVRDRTCPKNPPIAWLSDRWERMSEAPAAGVDPDSFSGRWSAFETAQQQQAQDAAATA